MHLHLYIYFLTFFAYLLIYLVFLCFNHPVALPLGLTQSSLGGEQRAVLPQEQCAARRPLTFSSLLLVRKSVDGFRMAVMALASSSWTSRLVDAVNDSVLNTNCSAGGQDIDV